MLLSPDAIWKIFKTALGIIIMPHDARDWRANVEVMQIINKNSLTESRLC